jgi:hypothetical protein
MLSMSPCGFREPFTGGTTVVTVQSGIGPETNPGLADIDPVQGGNQPGPSFAAWDVLSETADVAAALPAGVDVPAPFPWYRVKVVQSAASATAAFLTATGWQGDVGACVSGRAWHARLGTAKERAEVLPGDAMLRLATVVPAGKPGRWA